jgi:putative oxidoreductase
MPYLVLVGRILYAAIFLAAAPRHFTREGIEHARDLGVPLASIAVPLSGVLAIAGAASVLAGYHARAGAWLLVAFLVPVTLMMHAFWTLSDPAAVHVQQGMFMKNISMLGAAFVIAALGAGPMSLDARAQRADVRYAPMTGKAGASRPGQVGSVTEVSPGSTRTAQLHGQS